MIASKINLLEFGLCQQKELHTNPKAVQQTYSLKKVQLKNIDCANLSGRQSMFALTILEKNQRNKIEVF